MCLHRQSAHSAVTLSRFINNPKFSSPYLDFLSSMPVRCGSRSCGILWRFCHHEESDILNEWLMQSLLSSAPHLVPQMRRLSSHSREDWAPQITTVLRICLEFLISIQYCWLQTYVCSEKSNQKDLWTGIVFTVTKGFLFHILQELWIVLFIILFIIFLFIIIYLLLYYTWYNFIFIYIIVILWKWLISPRESICTLQRRNKDW